MYVINGIEDEILERNIYSSHHEDNLETVKTSQVLLSK